MDAELHLFYGFKPFIVIFYEVTECLCVVYVCIWVTSHARQSRQPPSQRVVEFIGLRHIDVIVMGPWLYMATPPSFAVPNIISANVGL